VQGSSQKNTACGGEYEPAGDHGRRDGRSLSEDEGDARGEGDAHGDSGDAGI
jgi:hypothetical protein